eukprot:g2821.t1
MQNAEVFICNPETSNLIKGGTFCQVRNTIKGYTTPTLDKTQYIKLISGQRSASRDAVATFSRTLSKSSRSELSYDIVNKSMGIIYARGNWSDGPMPKGVPLEHTYNGLLSQGINFFEGNNRPKPKPVPHIAGVWPNQFDSNMTIAAGQLPKNNKLITSVFARLRYDYTNRRQLWEYFDIKTGDSLGGELWIGTMLYYLNANRSECQVKNMTFDILKPTWLQQTKYITTNYLLRQSFANACGPVNYTDADLFQIPNTVGMTNSWLVANSPIAEPIRLMGPDNTNEPTSRSILEYITFQPHSKPFDESVFKIPKSCSGSSATLYKSFDKRASKIKMDELYPSGSGMFFTIMKSMQ